MKSRLHLIARFSLSPDSPDIYQDCWERQIVPINVPCIYKLPRVSESCTVLNISSSPRPPERHGLVCNSLHSRLVHTFDTALFPWDLFSTRLPDSLSYGVRLLCRQPPARKAENLQLPFNTAAEIFQRCLRGLGCTVLITFNGNMLLMMLNTVALCIRNCRLNLFLNTFVYKFPNLISMQVTYL